MGYEESTASSCDDSSEEPELSILTWSAFQRELKDKFNIIKIGRLFSLKCEVIYLMHPTINRAKFKGNLF